MEMAIVRMSFNRIPFLGAFAICTDKVAIFPSQLHFREQIVRETLNIPVIRGSLSKSPLIGILMAGNSSGFVCSDLFDIEGEGDLRRLGAGIRQVPGKFTAFGNLVLANDHGAIVNPDLPEEVLELIGESLGVPVERGTIAGIKNVGAAGVATNRGALLHPDVSEDELRTVEKVLRVPVDIGTACGGVKFVGLCMVANSNGAVVGMTTTGPELGRIDSALGFV
jgi:translation initiation factor 6